MAGTAIIYSTDNSIQCIPDPPSAKASSSHTGLEIGLGVGIPLGLLLLAAALFLCLCMRRRKRSRKAPPVAVLPVSTKGSDAVLVMDFTPHTSGNSGLTSYTNGSGAAMLATHQQAMNGGSSGGGAALAERRQSAGSAGGTKGETAGSGPIPALTGSEMQSVARLRMHDTIQASPRRNCAAGMTARAVHCCWQPLISCGSKGITRTDLAPHACWSDTSTLACHFMLLPLRAGVLRQALTPGRTGRAGCRSAV